MHDNPALEDHSLVEQCLSGSHDAWDQFYKRFLPLVRKAVHKHMGRWCADFQDLEQSVFLNLYTDLNNYDRRHPLSKFVWTVAQRVCIDEYRKSVSAKRSGHTVSVDHLDGCREDGLTLEANMEPQDKLLVHAQLIELVRSAFGRLGKKCSEILRLRYLEEMPFPEMSSVLGVDKKTLAVQAGRCIDELRRWYNQLERQGLGR